VFYAQICEDSQTLFFFFAKAESKMFTVIARKEFTSESPLGTGVGYLGYTFCNQVIEIVKVSISEIAEAVCDSFWIADFGTNKPESVNKRKSDGFLPLFPEVPERKFVRVLLPETDGLIADEQSRATACF
jgi:hypothetical protein